MFVLYKSIARLCASYRILHFYGIVEIYRYLFCSYPAYIGYRLSEKVIYTCAKMNTKLLIYRLICEHRIWRSIWFVLQTNQITIQNNESISIGIFKSFFV